MILSFSYQSTFVDSRINIFVEPFQRIRGTRLFPVVIRKCHILQHIPDVPLRSFNP